MSYFFYPLNAGITFGKQDDEGIGFCIMKSRGVT
jgi:hypothetical protein